MKPPDGEFLRSGLTVTLRVPQPLLCEHLSPYFASTSTCEWGAGRYTGSPWVVREAKGCCAEVRGVVREAEGCCAEAHGVVREAEWCCAEVRGVVWEAEGCCAEAHGVMREAEGPT